MIFGAIKEDIEHQRKSTFSDNSVTKKPVENFVKELRGKKMIIWIQKKIKEKKSFAEEKEITEKCCTEK